MILRWSILTLRPALTGADVYLPLDAQRVGNQIHVATLQAEDFVTPHWYGARDHNRCLQVGRHRFHQRANLLECRQLPLRGPLGCRSLDLAGIAKNDPILDGSIEHGPEVSVRRTGGRRTSLGQIGTPGTYLGILNPSDWRDPECGQDMTLLERSIEFRSTRRDIVTLIQPPSCIISERLSAPGWIDPESPAHVGSYGVESEAPSPFVSNIPPEKRRPFPLG
jgi:hypothetical protein